MSHNHHDAMPCLPRSARIYDKLRSSVVSRRLSSSSIRPYKPGMQQLQACLERDVVGRKRKHSIHDSNLTLTDSVHTEIHVSDSIAPLLTTTPFRRIRRLKQLGICDQVLFGCCLLMPPTVSSDSVAFVLAIAVVESCTELHTGSHSFINVDENVCVVGFFPARTAA